MFFEDIALKVPEIILPSDAVDLEKWAVIACDQYTSQPEYWKKVQKIVGNSPSTLNLVLPEAYLEAPDVEERINNINRTMKKYLDTGVLVSQKEGFMLIDRKTPHCENRKGLLVCLDLENYDFSRDANRLIRSTEDTIVDRLPPRMNIRRNALLELPHIMVLIDDPEHTVIEPLFKREHKTAYSTPLMLQGGFIKGFFIDDTEVITRTAESLRLLAGPEKVMHKYGIEENSGILYAVGDGNHSLASAKMIWQEIKKKLPDREVAADHPMRYAMVELVNLHDPGLVFEPIHRVIFNIELSHFLNEICMYYFKQRINIVMKEISSKETLLQERDSLIAQNRSFISFAAGKDYGIIEMENPDNELELATLQPFLDSYIKATEGSRIDYIHGDETLLKLGAEGKNIGLLINPIKKESVFKTILSKGPLPRKAFSMGEADEKRFYMECRKLVL